MDLPSLHLPDVDNHELVTHGIAVRIHFPESHLRIGGRSSQHRLEQAVNVETSFRNV